MYDFFFSIQLECGSGKFKNSIGSEPCTLCGNNSISRRTYCTCKPDHSRAIGEKENSSSHCYSKY